ncbi:hypothetical protein D3C80_1729310 [compost metagenome]
MQQEDHLIIQRRNATPQRCRQHQTADNLPLTHAIGLTGNPLLTREGFHHAGQQLGNVSAGIEYQRQRGAESGVAKQQPERLVVLPAQLHHVKL